MDFVLGVVITGVAGAHGKPAPAALYNAVIRAGLTFGRSRATIILIERWVHRGAYRVNRVRR